jgi:hypothetical protein
MKIGAGVLGASLLIAFATTAQTKPAKHHAKKVPSADSYAATSRDGGYVQQLADKMRFGSSGWWEQMRREGRLGGETP